MAEYDNWRPWPIWSAVWVGALAAIAVGLLIGLIGFTVGAHELTSPKFTTWKNVRLTSSIFNIAGAFFPAESYEVGAARLVRGQALIALDRGREARSDMEAVLDTFERVLGRDHPFLADPMTGLGQVALAERRPADAQGLLERAWEIRSTHTADGGMREQTAFSLAQAIWDAAPGDRRHALELATEAREGYSAIPDMAPRLTLVDRWLSDRQPAKTSRSRSDRL